jgi:hypothetical protein
MAGFSGSFVESARDVLREHVEINHGCGSNLWRLPDACNDVTFRFAHEHKREEMR